MIKKHVADGLTDYNNQTPINRKTFSYEPDLKKVRDYLVAQIGYGYIYFRQLTKGFKIVDITTIDKARALVGDVTNVDVFYPYYNGPEKTQKSKQCTIKITTSVGITYVVEIRSTKSDGTVVDNMQVNIQQRK